MRITHFTPGTGHFYCGSCLRDDTLVAALRARGHDVAMVPLYLPLVVERPGAPADDRVFLGGINMYLQHVAPRLGRLPAFLARRLDAPWLLRWLSSRSDMTDAEGHAAMAVSMLEGEAGRQTHEIEKLVTWMEGQPRPDVVCLSNIMLIGLVRPLKARFDVPIVCSLQGEAPFLDALPEPFRTEAWSTLAERAADVDAFVGVSGHYGALMQARLGFPRERLHVVHNGISMNGRARDEPPPAVATAPTIGFLARMCRDKGLHTLVDAFIALKRENAIPGLRLRAAGVVLKVDRPFVAELRRRVADAGFAGDATFEPNVTPAAKRAFLDAITVLSVPATYGESFGLYVLEALAHGVPVVEPRHGAFPEILEATGGGRLCEPDDPASLAAALRDLLLDGSAALALAESGRARVCSLFTAERMAREFENVCMVVR